jgi:hypothetical protein
MSSLKELTEDTTDRQDIRSRMAHLKTYAFFVFYQPSALNPNHPILQVLPHPSRRCTSNSEPRKERQNGKSNCSSTTWMRRAIVLRVSSTSSKRALRVSPFRFR